MSAFGEIAEPSSRATWEDWDDVSPEEHPNQGLHWERNAQVPEEIHAFLVLEGKYLSSCIKNQTRNLEHIDAIPEVNLQLYRSLVTSKYICTIHDYNLVLSGKIVQLLQKHLDVSANVIAIQTKPLTEYQTTELTDQDCVIRALATTRCISTDLMFPKLEQPNIISGLSAGVISLREHLMLPGLAIVCFMGHLEETQVEAMASLLEKLSISNPTSGPGSLLMDTNLYI